MALFGFIGVGNMGYPLLNAAINAFGKDQVVYSDASPKMREIVKDKTKIEYEADNKSVIQKCKYLVLVVKPQYFMELLEEIKGEITKDHVVISIAAGITIEAIKEILPVGTKIIRAMPNTPALVYQGMTGVCYSDATFSSQEREVAETFFGSYGRFEVFEEKFMNGIICASGSSPAYMFMIIEALADSVVKYGIPRDKAYTMVAQTMLGAATMVLESGTHPAVLKDQVCSPGGTTIAGVCALENQGLRNALMKATDACYERAEEISK